MDIENEKKQLENSNEGHEMPPKYRIAIMTGYNGSNFQGS